MITSSHMTQKLKIKRTFIFVLFCPLVYTKLWECSSSTLSDESQLAYWRRSQNCQTAHVLTCYPPYLGEQRNTSCETEDDHLPLVLLVIQHWSLNVSLSDSSSHYWSSKIPMTIIFSIKYSYILRTFKETIRYVSFTYLFRSAKVQFYIDFICIWHAQYSHKD